MSPSESRREEKEVNLRKELDVQASKIFLGAKGVEQREGPQHSILAWFSAGTTWRFN